MAIKSLLVLCCLLAMGLAGDVIVTPFTACTNCAVAWVIFPSASIFIMQTQDSTAWRSTNGGQTWQQLLTGVYYMELSPADPMSVVIETTARVLYTSTDGGQTMSKLTTPVTVNGFVMHPLNPAWLLIYNCAGSSCSAYYSKDFGKTWTTGPSNLAISHFIVWSNDPATPDTIFAVLNGQTAAYTTNYGASWTTLFSTSIGIVQTNHYLYIAVLRRGTAQLYSSSNKLDPSHMQTQYYWLDEFPNGNSLPEHGYTFLDDTTRAEFIGVKQPGSENWGNIFTSDFYGDQFALSLNYAVQREYLYDFDKLNGLPGIYVANAYPTATSPAANKQTYFTYDNGGEWKKLVAPTVNSMGIPTNCSLSDGCSLHIHGLVSYYFQGFSPFYSSPNAIGLMVAVGNLGQYLSTDMKTSSTYFTRDAGITWTELYKEPTIYEFGDHGGILVFATTNAPTNTIYYSLDEGKTLKSTTFTSTPINVENIFIEPLGTSQQFVLIGNLQGKHYIFGLDFSGLNLPTCQDSDYEQWSPSNDDNQNSKCFMGSQTVYMRRKQDAQCFNNRDNTDHVVDRTPCDCAWEDYECDVGFSPSPRNSMDQFNCTPVHAVPACATGYRLIPESSCDPVNGLKLVATNCPGYSGSPTATATLGGSTTGDSSGSGGSHGGTIAAVVILLVVIFGGAGGVGFLYYRNENFRTWVLSKLARGSSRGYGRVNVDENDEEAGDNTLSE